MVHRVLFCHTHANSTNGYSKIGFELDKYLGTKKDIKLTVYGFQNFNRNKSHSEKRILPSNVQVYDAFANETPKDKGFGFTEIAEFINFNKPDILIIYNDMGVVSNILEAVKKCTYKNFKIMIYADQVYLCQKKEYIQRLNERVNYVMLFSKFWEERFLEQGIKLPTGVLEHGFQPMMHYPIPRKLARQYFGLNPKEFIIVNSNRNQPRKRLDIMIMAFAEFIVKHLGEPIKLIVATAAVGSWNLWEIYEREIMLRNGNFDEAKKHITFLDAPQNLTDFEINCLYNAADVGINCCMGEGWGMCNFEGAGVGVPQIVPAIGGFLDFFDENSSIMIKPKIKLYTDISIDCCPGQGEICDSHDFAEGLEKYYSDIELRERHGKNARKNILKNYRWEDIGEKFYNHILAALGVSKEKENNEEIEITEKKEEFEKTDYTVNMGTIDSLEQKELLELKKKIDEMLKKKDLN